MVPSLTPAAAEILGRLRAENKELHLIIGDTGCCGYSNVFLTRNRPAGDYAEVGVLDGVRVYLRPPMDKTLDLSKVLIDVVESVADDSLSVETELGYRFVLRIKMG
ncbi:MAG: DUF779 domain-containing protein [Nitrososphaerota archaeon]